MRRSTSLSSRATWDVKATLTVYAHLIDTDDHVGNMAALGALAAPQPAYGGNVVPLWG